MPSKEPGLFALLSALPDQISSLVAKQLEMVKAEYKEKAVLSLIGLVTGGIAAVLLLFFFGVLLTWLFIALSSVLDVWIVGLIIGGSLLVLILIAGGISVLAFKKVGSWKPEKSIASFKEDYEVIIQTFTPKNATADMENDK